MLTGVIYGAIVVVWAAYLVPLALRRHDEASRTRSVERFSSAMRVLAKRGSIAGTGASTTADSRVVVTPGRGRSRVLSPEPAGEAERVLVTPRPNRSTERIAAARRRRVLSILVVVTFAVVVASLLGLAPLWSLAAPLALIVGFLVVARRSVRRANEPYWVDGPAREQAPGVVVRRSAVRVDASRGDTRETEDDEPTVTLTAVERKIAAGSMKTSDGGSLWDPLPVTLPTYVGAPMAKRTFRTIELGGPGTWSSGHSADASTILLAASTIAADPAPEPASDPDEVTEEVPRVVNG